MKKTQDLSSYDNSSVHDVGAGKVKYALWLICNALFLRNPLNFSSSIKKVILQLFGADIGEGTIFKPGINVKYPWKLTIGNYCWIGENVWLDNVETIIIGDNVCISQGALLLTGSHDHKKTTFDYLCDEIIIDDGVWIGAKAVVAKGVKCKTNSILSINSVIERDMEENVIYKGNPAMPVIKRVIQ